MPLARIDTVVNRHFSFIVALSRGGGHGEPLRGTMGLYISPLRVRDGGEHGHLPWWVGG